MPEPYRFINGTVRRKVYIEIIVRSILFVAFHISENMVPFIRVIQPEEFWLYKFPTTPSIVPSEYLYVVVLVSTAAVTLIAYGIDRKGTRAFKALCVPTLALPLTGIITNVIKITVGRPRPDFFNRCYGEDYIHVTDLKKPCIGEKYFVLDGRRSFPSGHSSMSFCMLGYVFLYLAYKLGTFTARGRGKSVRLILTLSPLILATLIAISRTCDYHHHWQDITVGSILGFVVVFMVYRQYFPSIMDDSGETDYVLFPRDDEEIKNQAGNNIYRETIRSNSSTLIKTV